MLDRIVGLNLLSLSLGLELRALPLLLDNFLDNKRRG
jgi:hypothetical protein